MRKYKYSQKTNDKITELYTLYYILVIHINSQFDILFSYLNSDDAFSVYNEMKVHQQALEKHLNIVKSQLDDIEEKLE